MSPYVANFPSKGDDSRRIIWEAVGRACSRWEATEVELCWLLAALMGMEAHSRESIEIYSKQPTFSGRSQALEKAIEQFAVTKPDQEIEAALYGALAESRRLAGHRNNIVHANVVVLRYSKMGTAPVFEMKAEFCLAPAYYDRKRIDENIVPEYIYLAADIDELSAQFVALTSEVEGITEWVHAVRP